MRSTPTRCWRKEEDSRFSFFTEKCRRWLSNADICSEITHQMRNMEMKLTMTLKRRVHQLGKASVQHTYSIIMWLHATNTLSSTTCKDFLKPFWLSLIIGDLYSQRPVSLVSWCLNSWLNLLSYQFLCSQQEKGFTRKFGLLLTLFLRKVQSTLTMTISGGTRITGKRFSIIPKISQAQANVNLSFWSSLTEEATTAQYATGQRNAVVASLNQVNQFQFMIF